MMGRAAGDRWGRYVMLVDTANSGQSSGQTVLQGIEQSVGILLGIAEGCYVMLRDGLAEDNSQRQQTVSNGRIWLTLAEGQRESFM